MKLALDLKKEIENHFGFVPAYFTPAFEDPSVLESLWTQMSSLYLTNPLPTHFKERLGAALSRYCSVSYCFIFHVTSLYRLGMPASEIHDFLQSSTLSENPSQGQKDLTSLSKNRDWPEKDSLLEKVILWCATRIYLNLNADECRAHLRNLLSEKHYSNLISYIGYKRMSMEWVEAHPELAYAVHEKTKKNLDSLLQDEPRLIVFFRGYRPSHANGVSIAIANDDLKTGQQRIQELIRKQAAIERERDRFIEISNDLFCVYDLEGNFKQVNPAFERVLGFSSDELLSRTMESLVHPEDNAQRLDQFEKLLSEGSLSAYENRFCKKDGTYCWLQWTAKLDQDEKVIYASARDISRHVKEREDLKRSENRFKNLANSMPQIVWVANPQGELIYTNQRWNDYVGSDDTIAWIQFVHPSDRDWANTIWTYSITTGSDYEIECRLIRKSDRSYRWHLVRATPERDDVGKIICWYAACTDIQDQKQIAEDLRLARMAAERANEAKSSFLANMSHEIRTPLGAITGFLGLMKNTTKTPEDIDHYMGIIDRNSQQVLRIIDDILDLSKVEAGMLLIETIYFSLLELLGDFASLMAFRAKEKGIQFHLIGDSEIPSRVHSDPTRIRQILTNVVGNAIKFTASGHVTLRISYRAPLILFRVEDSGKGITAEERESLFKPFSQADTSTTRKFGGTGLGLVLTRKLCEALNGNFSLEKSEAGKGSTFLATVQVGADSTATLLTPGEVKFEVTQKDDPGALDLCLSGMKVLVVEDSPDNQELLRILLKSWGMKAIIAPNGRNVVQITRENHFDLIIMDIQMPEVDGHEATKLLRKDGFTKPIIALSAHAMQEDRRRCVESGFSTFLPKPIDKHLLFATLKEFCKDLMIDSSKGSDAVSKDTKANGATARPTVLLVDDDEDIRSLLQEILEIENYEVEAVGSGRAAVKYLENKIPSIVLLDISLPDISGDEVMKILNEFPTRKQMKVVLCSGWDNLQQRTKDLHADGFIRKPYDINRLPLDVAKFLNSP